MRGYSPVTAPVRIVAEAWAPRGPSSTSFVRWARPRTSLRPPRGETEHLPQRTGSRLLFENSQRKRKEQRRCHPQAVHATTCSMR
eukprot:1249150-Alexandrium_andersonii.AAC.1